MLPWTDLFRRPKQLADTNARDWFADIADALLNRTSWNIGGESHRLTEIEVYYTDPAHPDPFTHGDKMQLECGRWYFHKTRGTYRSGSFKGVDLTFGDGRAYGGFLLRGLEKPDGELIDGPSLLVDYLIARSDVSTVAELDAAIAGRKIWDDASPLFLEEAPTGERDILPCARVGLSLKKAEEGSTMPQYLTRPYRYLTEPARIAKGNVLMVLGLVRLGHDADAIHERTGCPLKTITGYIDEYHAGRASGTAEEYFGADLGPKDICRLHGMADR